MESKGHHVDIGGTTFVHSSMYIYMITAALLYYVIFSPTTIYLF